MVRNTLQHALFLISCQMKNCSGPQDARGLRTDRRLPDLRQLSSSSRDFDSKTDPNPGSRLSISVRSVAAVFRKTPGRTARRALCRRFPIPGLGVAPSSNAPMSQAGAGGPAETALIGLNRVVVLIHAIANRDGVDSRTAREQCNRRRRASVVLEQPRIQIGIHRWDTAGARSALKLQIEPIVQHAGRTRHLA